MVRMHALTRLIVNTEFYRISEDWINSMLISILSLNQICQVDFVETTIEWLCSVLISHFAIELYIFSVTSQQVKCFFFWVFDKCDKTDAFEHEIVVEEEEDYLRRDELFVVLELSTSEKNN